jgi:hypothetical protein
MAPSIALAPAPALCQLQLHSWSTPAPTPASTLLYLPLLQLPHQLLQPILLHLMLRSHFLFINLHNFDAVFEGFIMPVFFGYFASAALARIKHFFHNRIMEKVATI